MKLKKILTLACCAVLLVCISVGATVAYLTSEDTVTNTFSVGKVTITMDEAKVNTEGKILDAAGKADGEEGFSKDNLAARVKTNSYKLMPGHLYTKDPTIHVSADSEDCWLFVKVVDEIAAIEDAKTIETQLTDNGWTLVSGQTNVYAYNSIVSHGSDVKVFESFKIKGDAVTANYENKSIVIKAYAVQADGFATSDAAWSSAPNTKW